MKLSPTWVGLLLATAGVGLQLLYMRRFEADVSGGRKIELLVAAQPLERGKPVRAEMLGVRAVPQAYVDDRAVRAEDRDKVVNLRATNQVPALQSLAWTDFIAVHDDQRDLSSLVQPGNRAMPIKVQSEESLELIRPGDFVDVLAVDADGREASVLLQRVLVLAAGLETSVERSSEKSTGPSARLLTVSVTLAEAQLLGLAQTIGRLWVVVRGAEDPRVFESPPDVSRSDLFDAHVRQNLQRNARHPVPIRLEPEVP
ncbi:MAG TPA: Flp pilus assembly protein CpaB [Polyangiaceae bacterium]|nr:Flp pilus assembly protein CpaB [Polyangiaceae bacterium]